MTRRRSEMPICVNQNILSKKGVRSWDSAHGDNRRRSFCGEAGPGTKKRCNKTITVKEVNWHCHGVLGIGQIFGGKLEYCRISHKSECLTMNVSIEEIKKATSRAAYARDNLTIKREGKHCPKVCCVCDRILLHGDQHFLSFDKLKTQQATHFLGKSTNDLPKHSDKARETIQNYYTPRCFAARSSELRWTKKLYLSPRSYEIKSRKMRGFGACRGCFNAVESWTKKDCNARMPEYAIANGFMIGEVPDELACLNDVEVALISLARVDKHVFSIQGGAHVQMSGWHSMYANDVTAVSRGVNWCANNIELDDDGFDDDEEDNSEENDCFDDTSNGNSDDEEDDDSEENDDEQDPQNNKLKLASIFVVIAGPFTSEQYAYAKKKTQVNWVNVQRALMWLKNNNPWYAQHAIDDTTLSHPVFLEKVEMQPSQNSNIEKNFEFCCIFPDGTNADHNNGGQPTRKGFKEVTLERMLTQCGDRETTLISRPTQTLLKDYEGENLLVAFPLQFPYGIGSRTKNDEQRSGAGYLEHLSYLSSKEFQRGDFTCIIGNIMNRSVMVRESFVKNKGYMSSHYGDVNNQQLQDAINRYTEGVLGHNPADIFLSKMRAVTRHLPHTHAAAKLARQHVFSMLGPMSLPSFMLTATLDDERNHRILTMHAGFGCDGPPSVDSDFEAKHKHLLFCREVRRDYPGFCALDYENFMRIIVEEFLGWDRKKKKNKKNTGIFGDVEAYVVATEEQGRKTLHGHILVWIRDWDQILEGISNPNGDVSKQYVEKLRTFASRIMSTSIYGKNSAGVVRPCKSDCPYHERPLTEHMKLVDAQDVRNLRHKDGKTCFGDKNIMKCEGCNGSFSSEDLAVSTLISKFGRVNICTDDVTPTCHKGFWEKNLHMTKPQVIMENLIMNEMLPHTTNRKPSDAYVLEENVRISLAVSRNLHKSVHVNKCFKRDKECRMKIPNMPSRHFDIKFEREDTNWYAWDGTNKPRKLFHVIPQRSEADLFGNIYSEPVSSVFACNSNVVGPVDGGSPMYITAYHSKNTQQEDSEKSAHAAAHMVRRLKEKIKEKEQCIDTGESLEDDEKQLLGIRAMIGAVLMATNAHVVSAPMASFLIRNRSRFEFSHEFQFVCLSDFIKEASSDYAIGTNEEGTPYIKSSVANYTMRPKELEDVCLYDFISEYFVGPKTSKTMKWHGDHPSGNYRGVGKREKGYKIPLINYLDFPDTKSFEGQNLFSCEVPDPPMSCHVQMEIYAKKAGITFVPFRDVEKDLKLDGSFLQKFREYVLLGKLKPRHERILKNFQICRNSLNAGRPLDPLEKVTENLYDKKKNPGDVNDDIMQDLLCELVDDTKPPGILGES